MSDVAIWAAPLAAERPIAVRSRSGAVPIITVETTGRSTKGVRTNARMKSADPELRLRTILAEFLQGPR